MSDETREPRALAAWAKHTRLRAADRMAPCWPHEIDGLSAAVVLHLCSHAQLRARWSEALDDLRGSP